MPAITALYAAFLTFVLVALILRIVRLRWKLKVGLGDGGDRVLIKAMRAHGNFIETTPWVLLLMLLMEINHAAPGLFLHAYGCTLIAARLLHAWGISNHSGFTPGRGIGMVLTVTLMVTGASILLLYYFAV